jgi:hypothetical protein
MPVASCNAAEQCLDLLTQLRQGETIIFRDPIYAHAMTEIAESGRESSFKKDQEKFPYFQNPDWVYGLADVGVYNQIVVDARGSLTLEILVKQNHRLISLSQFHGFKPRHAHYILSHSSLMRVPELADLYYAIPAYHLFGGLYHWSFDWQEAFTWEYAETRTDVIVYPDQYPQYIYIPKFDDLEMLGFLARIGHPNKDFYNGNYERFHDRELYYKVDSPPYLPDSSYTVWDTESKILTPLTAYLFFDFLHGIDGEIDGFEAELSEFISRWQSLVQDQDRLRQVYDSLPPLTVAETTYGLSQNRDEEETVTLSDSVEFPLFQIRTTRVFRFLEQSLTNLQTNLDLLRDLTVQISFSDIPPLPATTFTWTEPASDWIVIEKTTGTRGGCNPPEIFDDVLPTGLR